MAVIAPVTVIAPEAIVPTVMFGVPVNPPAVPVVFWFSVGKVQLVNVPEVGVPRIGVTNVGLVDNTTLPVPVEVVTPVPPLATGNVPVTPVLKGKPVQLVKVPEDGVPRTGVVSVGLVNVLLVNVSVVARPTNVSVAAGKVNVVVPAAAVATTVVFPDVEPANWNPAAL